MYLKNELDNLKNKSTLTKDKITVFIRLVRKYAKKLSALSKLLPVNTNGSNEENNIFSDIFNTITQFYQMIYNPKLNENVFEISDLLTTEESIKQNINCDSPYTLKGNSKNENEYYTKIKSNNMNNKMNSNLSEHYQNLMRKYEEKFKLLISENDSLRKFIKNKENEKGKYEKEIIDLNEKLKNEKNINEDLLNKYNSINTLSEELQNKIQNLENENLHYKNKVSELSDNITKYESLRNKNEMLLNDLNYKNSVVKYLENLLKRTNLNPKLFTEETYKEEYQKDKSINNENDENMNEYLIENNQTISDFNSNNNNINNNNINNNNIKQDIQISQSKHSSNRKEKISSNRINDKLIDEDDINAIRPNQIKKEIDNLDEEIFKLQTQLKKMLNK